jgi:hypothetical protein
MTRVCTRYVKRLFYVIVLLVAIDIIMHIFDPNLSCLLSAIRVRHRHVPKLSGNGWEDTIGKMDTSEME